MPLLKTRPRITVRAPAAIRPGESFDVHVHLAARRPVPVHFVSATFYWFETLVRAGQHPYFSVTREIGRQLLSGRATLPGGTTVHEARFLVPDGAPPSYRGRNALSQYHLEVHVSIPWWPDRRTTFALGVAPSPVAVQARPVRYSTAPEGTRSEPFLEVSLANDAVEPGGTLAGAFAIGNAELHRFDSVEIALVAVERIRIATGTVREEVQRFRLHRPPPVPGGSEQAEFEMVLPERLNPTTSAERWALTWHVELEVRRSWGFNLVARVPVTVRPGRADGAGRAGERISPPVVGSDRMRALWTAVGGRVGLTLSEHDELRGTRGAAEVAIRRERRGREGTFLVGELRFPPLHLGLDVHPRRGLTDRLLGFRVGPPAWADRWYAFGRDEGQIRALLTPRLQEAIEGLEIARLDDATAAAERRDAGLSSDRLAAFAVRLVELADTLGEARREIPPPAPLTAGLDAWRALADRLSSTLETARMSIEGRHGGVRAVVETEWTAAGKPRHTIAALHPDAPLRPEQTARLTAASAPALTASLSAAAAGESALPDAVLRYPATARALLGDLLRQAYSIELSPEGMVALLPAPLEDPAPALDALDSLARIRSVLHATGGGPYR